MYCVGPGWHEVKLSIGFEARDLEESHAGPFMLPCSVSEHDNNAEATQRVLADIVTDASQEMEALGGGRLSLDRQRSHSRM